MATVAQVNQYNDHRSNCQALGIPQSTLKHSGLKGTVSAPSSTGVTTYTGPDPRTTPSATTDTPVWAVWQPQLMRSSNEPESGRQGEQRLICQFPSIDGNLNTISVAHDDTLTDGNGTSYRVLNPTIQPDLGFWTCELIKRR